MVILPRKINLVAIKKQWRVSYIKSSCKLMIVELPHRELVLYGKNYSKKSALLLITNWLRLKADDYLKGLVRKLNRRVKAKYKDVKVRSNYAQWGSCSHKKILSLNYKLIFLPPPLVRNLIYHELCHLKYLDHSERFWQELKKYDKNYKKNDALLADSDLYLPNWIIV